MTLGGTLPVISSSSTVDFRAWAPALAEAANTAEVADTVATATAAANRASDFLIISSRLSLASTSAAANSASSF